MTEPKLFVLADTTLLAVVDQIQDDQWEMEMPDDFLMRDQKSVTLREVINYHAYDDAWVPDMLAGKTMAEVGADAFKGDLLGDTPKENFRKIVEKACVAAGAISDLDQIVHCSFGDYKIREYLWQINSFRGFRAHDIAKVIGADTTLPPLLVEGLWDELAPMVEEWRKIGVFGPAVLVGEHDTLQNKLLGMVGRQPD
jgi:hypothetical protein